MFTKGHIIVKRTIQEWGWYHNPKTLAFMIHLVVEANFQDCEWEGTIIKRGELVTTLLELSKDVGITLQETRTIMKRLGGCGEVRARRVGKRSIITVCNYDSYQDTQHDCNTIATRLQHPIIEEGNKGIMEEKKTSNDVKEKKSSIFHKPTVDEVAQYSREHGYDIDAQYFVDFYESKGWVVGKSPMKDWKAAVRTWVKNNKRNDVSLFNQQPQEQQQKEPMYHSVEEWEAAQKSRKQ